MQRAFCRPADGEMLTVQRQATRQRSKEASQEHATTPSLSNFVTALLPFELAPPVAALLRFVGVGEDGFEDRYGLLPSLAETLSTLAKATSTTITSDIGSAPTA